MQREEKWIRKAGRIFASRKVCIFAPLRLHLSIFPQGDQGKSPKLESSWDKIARANINYPDHGWEESDVFEITIKRAAELSPEEETRVTEVDHLAFSAPDSQPSEDEQDIEWSSPDWLVLGWLDGQIVSLLGIVRREIRVGDETLPVAGIGGVATHPEFQRRGLAARLMERAAGFMREELKVPFGLLVCSDLRQPYYARLGWQPVAEPMVFDWRGSKRVFPENTMIFTLGDRSWPIGTVDLCGKPW
jgi:predicted N-acetyltransferase YhbS